MQPKINRNTKEHVFFFLKKDSNGFRVPLELTVELIVPLELTVELIVELTTNSSSKAPHGGTPAAVSRLISSALHLVDAFHTSDPIRTMNP